MEFHSAIAKALKDHGIDTMFGLMADANQFMIDRYVRDEGGRYVAGVHEMGAVLMSYGYARRSGRLGVSTVAHGAGVTNAVTALTEGARTNTPMLMISGDTTIDRNLLQGLEQRPVVESSEAGFERINSPATALATVARAIQRAETEHRPIVLSIPTEWFSGHPSWEEVDYYHVPIDPAKQTFQPDPDAVDQACGVIASVRQPLVLIGHGVTTEALPKVLALAERIGAPVATTLAAKGHDVNEPFGIGVCGTYSTNLGAETILAADCIVAFGASLNQFTTALGSYTKEKAIIHCDVDPASIGRHVAPTAAVVGDAGATAALMLEMIEEAGIKAKDFRSPDLKKRLAERQLDEDYRDKKADDTDVTVDVRQALRRINAAVPKNRSVVSDGGRWMSFPIKMFDVPTPNAFTLSLGIGAIGLGMATAIGSAIAAPEAPTLLASGDGSFMSGGLEFSTAVRENLDLIVVVGNDGAYGAEIEHFRAKSMDGSLSKFDWPDLGPVAEALGGRGVTVRNEKDLDAAEEAIAGRDRPLLIDLKLDPETIPFLM